MSFFRILGRGNPTTPSPETNFTTQPESGRLGSSFRRLLSEKEGEKGCLLPPPHTNRTHPKTRRLAPPGRRTLHRMKGKSEKATLKWHYQGSGRFTKQAGSPLIPPARCLTIRFLRGHDGSPTTGHNTRGGYRAKYRKYKLGSKRGSNRGTSSQDSEGGTSTHRQNHRKTPSHGTKRERPARKPPRGARTISYQP